MKISEESSAASSCSVEESCTTSRGGLTTGGGAGSPIISNFMHLKFLAPLACLEVAGRSFLWVLRLCTSFSGLFTPVPPCTGLLKPSPEGSIICDVQRKPFSPCPHPSPQAPTESFSSHLFFLGAGGVRQGCLRRERQGAIPVHSKRWCDCCHPSSVDVMGMRIAELRPHAALCK